MSTVFHVLRGQLGSVFGQSTVPAAWPAPRVTAMLRRQRRWLSYYCSQLLGGGTNALGDDDIGESAGAGRAQNVGTTETVLGARGIRRGDDYVTYPSFADSGGVLRHDVWPTRLACDILAVNKAKPCFVRAVDRVSVQFSPPPKKKLSSLTPAV